MQASNSLLEIFFNEQDPRPRRFDHSQYPEYPGYPGHRNYSGFLGSQYLGVCKNPEHPAHELDVQLLRAIHKK